MDIKKYDVAIIGGGMSGLMLAYKLLEKTSNINIVILEEGKDIGSRKCPILEKKSSKCIGCDSCSIMNGVAGAGAFSDGKFIITSEYGGWLSDFIGTDQALKYMEMADDIIVSLGATEERYKVNNKLKRECLENELHIKEGEVKHLGTEKTYEIMKKLVDIIKQKCIIMTNSKVIDLNKEEKIIKIIDGNEIKADNIIFSVGRSGNGFLSNWCIKNNISLKFNPVDIGVRVELPSILWKDISNIVYDPKISYKSKIYGDYTRMFCFNDGGNVVIENTDKVCTVNGHAYSEQNFKTDNSNFALLSSIHFSDEFIDPIEYMRNIARSVNLISGGNVIVQRFGDLINGKRTTDNRLLESTVKPTLDATPGDLSLCIPKRQLDNIIETIHQLNKIAPGTSNYDTLLYGLECKYYSSRPKMNNFELENCNKVFACGDGAGITRSLAQAAANGLYLGELIAEQYK